MKQLLLRIAMIALFLLLMLNPQITVAGASTGLLLWFHSIIPSLLPFMIVSNLLISLNGISLFTGLLHPLTGRLLGISQNGAYALLTGFVCGYPIGAKTCADLLCEHKISKPEAQYLLCFVNNPGPAFLSGYILQKILEGRCRAWPFFVAVYGAPLLFAIFLRIWGYPHKQKEGYISTPPFTPYLPDARLDFGILDRAIMNGFETVTRLGGYIILFSIISEFLLKPQSLSMYSKMALLAVTEITTGSNFIGTIGNIFPLSAGRDMALCACISFGGLSGIFQTKSVINDTGLLMFPYVISKLCISLLSALLYLMIA